MAWTIPEGEAAFPALHVLAENRDVWIEKNDLQSKLQPCFQRVVRGAQWNIVSNKDKPTNLIFKGLVEVQVFHLNKWIDFNDPQKRLPKGAAPRSRLRITSKGWLFFAGMRSRCESTRDNWFCGQVVPEDDAELEAILSDGRRSEALSTGSERESSTAAIGQPDGPGCVLAPVPKTRTKSFFVKQQERTEAFRREDALRNDFQVFIEDNYGYEAQVNRIPDPEMETDLFFLDIELLIEAKAGIERPFIRMAIGQLADYERYVKPKRCGVLLPERPAWDILELLRARNIEVYWKTDGGFACDGESMDERFHR